MDTLPPKLDPTYFGWENNQKLETLMPIGVPKDRKPAPDEVLKLSSAPVHYRSHMPQIGAVVHLANYHVALCVHVMEAVGDAAMTRPRKGKMMMGTQLI